MKQFKPTWLYIKQHNSTGLKYFGKTISADPLKYQGSGVVWTRHLKKHGNNVSTLWCHLFFDQQSLTEYAINFSKENNIVESSIWANLKIEDGLMGGSYGEVSRETRLKLSENSKKHKHTKETKEKLRLARLSQKDPRIGKKHTEETKKKIRQKRALQIITPESCQKRAEKMKGKIFSDERNLKISNALKGKPKSEEHKIKLSAAAKARRAGRIS
jgi:hypothetical protein